MPQSSCAELAQNQGSITAHMRWCSAPYPIPCMRDSICSPKRPVPHPILAALEQPRWQFDLPAPSWDWLVFGAIAWIGLTILPAAERVESGTNLLAGRVRLDIHELSADRVRTERFSTRG
ncbi:hypothetical protein PIB30_065290 [Stylosanthes scabra]|uniref:Uncharacterized protein n=1 Tax=Stylosanthes scabra TaxID=79078 RepID=A0ABU6QLX8_9FABA|nr:hypothetical protein [Stylosanthes scabra]